jgi:hypothetical protein
MVREMRSATQRVRIAIELKEAAPRNCRPAFDLYHRDGIIQDTWPAVDGGPDRRLPQLVPGSAPAETYERGAKSYSFSTIRWKVMSSISKLVRMVTDFHQQRRSH